MQINTSSHLDEETLELYALGRLSEELLPHFEEHILFCESCRDRLEQTEEYIRVVSTATQELGRDKAKAGSLNLSSRFSWLWVVPKPAWAGAFAAVLAMAVIPMYRQGRPAVTTEVAMIASRGLADKLVSQAPAGQLVLRLDTSELPAMPAYRLQVVDSSGRDVWTGSVSPVKNQIRTALPSPLEAGNYWVRLYSPDGTRLLRESGLAVK